MSEGSDVLFHEGKAVGLRCRRCGEIRSLDEKFCKCETAKMTKDINEVYASAKILLNENTKGEYANDMRVF